MNEATTTLNKKCKAKLLKVLFLATIFLLTASGCSTYMGYDAVKYQEDIPGMKKDLKETTLDYRVDVIEISSDRKNINLIGKYEVERIKSVAEFENREHIELKQSFDTAVGMFVFTPVKCIFDCLLVFSPWKQKLASNPPGFFTQLTYIPPFSWFAIFQCPPYYFEDYHKLKEGVNTYEETNKYGQKIARDGTIKYISREKVKISQKEVFYKQLEERFIIDKKQFVEAKNFLQKKADSGDSVALLNLAQMYFYGIGVKQNSKTAISLLQKAVNQGNQQAENLIKLFSSAQAHKIKSINTAIITKSTKNKELKEDIQFAIKKQEDDYLADLFNDKDGKELPDAKSLKVYLEKTTLGLEETTIGGLGLIIGKNGDDFIVHKVIDNYPAKIIGIQEKDQLLMINGQLVTNYNSIADIINDLRGKSNSNITISIRHHSDRMIRTIILTRRVITTLMNKKRLAYIKDIKQKWDSGKKYSKDLKAYEYLKINNNKDADFRLKYINFYTSDKNDLEYLIEHSSNTSENNEKLLELCLKLNQYDLYIAKERRMDLWNIIAMKDDISTAEKIFRNTNTSYTDFDFVLRTALQHDSKKIAELLLLATGRYSFNYKDALLTTAANEEGKCLPLILARKKFSLEELAYALDKAIKCNSIKNVRLILKYMDPLLKPEMSIGMNCAVPISKNNQEILSELTKRNIKISISSLADLIKFNSPKTIENVKFVIRDKKIWDLASPDMDSAMLASAETGNIGVLKLLIANGGEINCANDKDETPLIIARNKGHIEYVRYIASQGGTDSILAIKRYREQIKDKREKLKVQKRKDFFQQHRVRHAAEIKKLRQKFFNQKLAHADKATMDMLIDKSCKIIWYNDDYPQCMEAINLRLSSTPEKNKFYGTVDTVLAVEDLYPNYKNLYKKLNSFTSRRGAVADSDIQKKARMIILTNALCSAWAEDDEINYMQTELNKMKEELDSIGPGLSAGMGIASLGIQRLTPIFIKILENAQTSKKTFKIMVKIEKGTDGLEYITVKSLDPYVSITDSNLY